MNQPKSRFDTVLVDAGNLHSGGGVQVAASFIDEIAKLLSSDTNHTSFPWLHDIAIEVSAEVAANVAPQSHALALRTVQRRGRLERLFGVGSRSSDFGVVFTVFGPAYGKPRGKIGVTGCADVVSFYGPTHLDSIGQRLKWKLRGWFVRRSFVRSDLLIVETEAMRSKVSDVLNKPVTEIAVVPNTTNAIFDNRSLWKPLSPTRLPLGSSDQKFAFVTRGYSHKNLDFLGELHGPLQEHLGTTVNWVVTLSDQEWNERTDLFRASALNLGPVPIESVPAIYENCDGLIFPSLLEAFSASPLEGLKMGIPVFASDRDFIHSTCNDTVTYFNPLDPLSAAETIADALADKGELARKSELGSRLVASMPSAHARAVSYIRLIDNLVQSS